jgi:hypothetical protein
MANTTTETGDKHGDAAHGPLAEERLRFAAAAADIVENPEKYKKLWDEKARRDNPHLTQSQLDASWEQIAQQFGL